jgi:hypothetical protein
MKVIDDCSNTSKQIEKLFQADEPFAIGRMPGNEADVLMQWWRAGKDIAGVSEGNYLDLETNTGFYAKPQDRDEILTFYCHTLFDSLRECDLLFRLENEYAAAKDPMVEDRYDEIHVWSAVRLHQWIPLLEGKRVLVIGPYQKSIQQQWEKRDQLREGFSEGTPSFNFPDFELLTINSHNTVKGNDPFPHSNWKESFIDLCTQADDLEFDIAILGCGGYSMPLLGHILSTKRSAFCTGSYAQIMFGITGQRWLKHNTMITYRNDAWKTPEESERPKTYRNIEGGCYW